MKASLVTLLVCASIGEARAERDATNQLGFGIAFDQVPIAGHRVMQMGIGLAVEHPVFRHWRVFGEYEYLWLTEATTDQMDVALDGSGHRSSIGLRRQLVGTTLGKVLTLSIDGEVGGGVGIFSDNLTGAHIMPHAFAGLRLGYVFRAREADDASPPGASFGAAFTFRAIAVEHGIGGMFGLGFAWGG